MVRISPGLSPKKRRPTLPLSSTPRLAAMPSTRSLGSRISKLSRLGGFQEHYVSDLDVIEAMYHLGNT